MLQDFQTSQAVQYRCPWCGRRSISAVAAMESGELEPVHFHDLPFCPAFENATNADHAVVLETLGAERQPIEVVTVERRGGKIRVTTRSEVSTRHRLIERPQQRPLIYVRTPIPEPTRSELIRHWNAMVSAGDDELAINVFREALPS